MAKLTLDRDRRAPSIERITNLLQRDVESIKFLREEHGARASMPANVLPGGLDIDVLEQMREDERVRYADEFDARFARVSKAWKKARDSDRLKRFMGLRNKVTAHTEMHLDPVAGEYRVVQIPDLGLRWDDLGLALQELEPIVDDLNQLVRVMGFNFEDFRARLERRSRAFWAPGGAVEGGAATR